MITTRSALMHMTGKARLSVLGALVIGCSLLAVPSSVWAKDQTKTETYDNGKPHLVYSVDSRGRKNGEYRELAPDGRPLVIAGYANDQLNGPYRSFFPSGKPKVIGVYAAGKLSGKYREYGESGGLAVTAAYIAGELNGARQETLSDGAVRTENWKLGKLHGWRRDAAKDRLVNEQFWYDGLLIIPKGPALINQELAAIEQADVPIRGEFPKVPEKLDATLHSANLADENKAGLRTLMQYRYLCDLPYKDMQIDRDFMAHAQAAAEITERIGKLDHTPENPGMLEDEYRFAYKGTSSSNLFTSSGGATAAQSVESYLDDSDERNIDALGHRRWCLNPAMLKTGFGVSGNYSAMWSIDGSRGDASNFDFVAFPPRGLTPTRHFKSTYAWSISLDPQKYADPNQATKVTVTPMQFDAKRMHLEAASEPLEIEKLKVAEPIDGRTKITCVIFRPKGTSVVAGSVYKVNAEGIKDINGEPAPIEYFVGFFEPAKK